MDHKKIMVIDDDPAILNLLDLKLSNEGFSVVGIADGKMAIDMVNHKKPTLIILDVNMPRMNGWDVCKTLKSNKKTKNIPIIMLTVKNEPADRVLGLEFGADDYITKPFDTRELILRIKNILRRVYQKKERSDRLDFEILSVDLGSHEVRVKDCLVQLTPTELKLLAGLMEDPGQVKSRDTLLEQVWEYSDKVYSRTVDTHIQRLRTKLREAGRYIETVRGVGYRFH